MKLTASQVKSAKPKEKNYKLSDGGGLFLLVTTSGSKYWRLKYRYHGKEKLFAIGVYKDAGGGVTLAEARAARDEAKKLLASGIDPTSNKRDKKLEEQTVLNDDFRTIALEWFAVRSIEWSESHKKRVISAIDKELTPSIGKTKLSEITPILALNAIKRVEARGAIETAHRVKQVLGQIMRYGITLGLASYDPTSSLNDALKRPIEKHLAAIVDPIEAKQLFDSICSYSGSITVQSALKLSALFFCRPGELRHLEWDDINWEENRIEIPAERMKLKQPHIIPLAKRAKEILTELKLFNGGSRYIFPSPRGHSRPLSENGVRTALRTMGYSNDEMTPHGFRAMARTILDEHLNYPVIWIEQQLAHQVRDFNGRAYNRTKHLKQRTEMMQGWEDFLYGK